MNSHAELQRLKENQRTLEQQIHQLKQDLSRLEQQIGNDEPLLDSAPQASTSGAKTLTEPVASPAMVRDDLIPPPIHLPDRPARVSAASSPHESPGFQGSPLPLLARPFTPETSPSPSPIKESTDSDASRHANVPLAPPPEARSFEVTLGTNWFARLGVIMLLTALGFFARYAYQRIVPSLGPGGKIALMYLAGGFLLGTGVFIGRRQERLRNYGQVLAAGGFAAIYFTTYAAHYIPSLRIIASPTLAGTLLLGCAALLGFYADRTRSQPTALFAILLAYYTASLNPIGLFTLASNCVLTIAAVIFLVRNRWSAVTIASLGASYASYAYWQHFRGAAGWHWSISPDNFALGAISLAGYWIVFTTGGLLSRDDEFRKYRIPFLTANNAAFFGLAAWDVSAALPGSFWSLALGFGITLIATSVAIRRWNNQGSDVADMFIAQGLLLITVGFIARFSGVNLSLILAAESVVLLQLGMRLRLDWYERGAWLCAVLSAGWAVAGLRPFHVAGLAGGAGAASLLFFNGWWSSGKTTDDERTSPFIFTASGLAIAFVATWRNVSSPQLASTLALEGLAFVGMYYLLRLPEMARLGQIFTAMGALTWCATAHSPPSPLWTLLVVVLANQTLSHWWQHQQGLSVSPRTRQWWQGVFAFAAIALIYYRLLPDPPVPGPGWLWRTSLAAAALTAYATLTRAPITAALAQVFVAAMVLESARLRQQDWPVSIVFLLPIAVLLVLSEGGARFCRKRSTAPWAPTMESLSQVYFWTAATIGLWSLHDALPERNRTLAELGTGAALFVIGHCARHRNLLRAGLLFAAGGIWQIWLRDRDVPFQSLELMMLIAWLVLEQWQRKRGQPPFDQSVRQSIVVTAGLTIWIWISHWMQQRGGFYVTASWSLLALLFFGAGLLLRERVHRWLGLCILGFAIGRVVLFDVWRLEAFYRIISFVVLGVVLLVLGYVYNRYQERVREWL